MLQRLLAALMLGFLTIGCGGSDEVVIPTDPVDVPADDIEEDNSMDAPELTPPKKK